MGNPATTNNRAASPCLGCIQPCILYQTGRLVAIITKLICITCRIHVACYIDTCVCVLSLSVRYMYLTHF